MEIEEIKSLSDYWQILLRRRYLIAIPMLILFIISVIVALILPSVYRSEATVLIEQQHIPTEFVQSTVISLADERIRQIEQKIMTINNVIKIIDKYGLYSKQRNKISNTELAFEFRENTELNIVTANVVSRGRLKTTTMAFKLSFSHKDPVIAQKITNEIVTLYLDENIRNRTARALETTVFLDEESEKFKQDIQKIENKIAQYKEKYSDSLPELLTVNVASISRIENTLQQLSMQEKMLTERRISLRHQLTITSMTPAVAFDGANSEGLETLETLEKRFNYLSSKYSALHPDVKAVKRKIDNWQPTSSTLAGGAENITNPVYLQLKSEMDIAVVELQNINKERKTLQSNLKQLEIRVSQTHQVERGYYDLMRDLDNHRIKYKELKAKALEARLSQTLEEEQKAEKFSLLEPARVPRKPIKPNRFKILVMGLALSIGVGLSVGYITEVLDGSVRGHRSLEQVIGFEPLVIIPYIENQEDVDKRKRSKRNFIIIAILLSIGAILATHFLYKPLDLLWFKVWHRISML